MTLPWFMLRPPYKCYAFHVIEVASLLIGSAAYLPLTRVISSSIRWVGPRLAACRTGARRCADTRARSEVANAATSAMVDGNRALGERRRLRDHECELACRARTRLQAVPHLRMGTGRCTPRRRSPSRQEPVLQGSPAGRG